MASPCLKKFSNLHFFRQKLSAASRLPLGGFSCRTAAYGSFGSLLLAKQGGEGQLHFRFKLLNNSAIPFPIFPLAFPFGESGEPPRGDRGLLKYPLLPSLPLARLPLKCSFGNPKRKVPKTNYPQNNIINPQTGAAVFQPLPSLSSLCFRHFRAIAAISPSVQSYGSPL